MSDQSVDKSERGIRRISSLADSWWKILTWVGAIGFFVYQSIVAWLDIQASIKQGKDNKEDIKFLMERTATKDEIKAVDDKVTRQWSIQSESNNRQDKDIRDIKEKQVYEDGRRAGQNK